jgi:RND family efflux transporter MFP subunit
MDCVPHRASRALIAAFVVGLCVSSCTTAEVLSEKPRPVRAQQVVIADGTSTLVQTGEIQPRRESDLSFAIGGRLERRLVEVGAVVGKGQPLALLDDGLVQNELRAAEADLTSASAALELAQSSSSRLQRLFETQSVSLQQIDEATTNVRAAVARRDVAAAAALNARQKLSYATLRAPEAGVVTAIGANAGQVLGPGQMVVRLATRERDAVFSVAEQIVANAPHDVKVQVRLVSNPSIGTIGSVHEVSPAADPATRTYRVRVALEDAPEAMAFGAAVTGAVEYPEGPLVALPASALTSEADKPAVYVVDPATSALKRRPVQITRMDATRVFISSGLNAGDQVVTAGVHKLRPDQVVTLGGVGGNAP